MTTQATGFPRIRLNSESGVLSWLFTVDHKRIGVLYIVSALSFFFLGGIEALLMRIQLASPENIVPKRPLRVILASSRSAKEVLPLRCSTAR